MMVGGRTFVCVRLIMMRFVVRLLLLVWRRLISCVVVRVVNVLFMILILGSRLVAVRVRLVVLCLGLT